MIILVMAKQLEFVSHINFLELNFCFMQNFIDPTSYFIHEHLIIEELFNYQKGL